MRRCARPPALALARAPPPAPVRLAEAGQQRCVAALGSGRDWAPARVAIRLAGGREHSTAGGARPGNPPPAPGAPRPAWPPPPPLSPPTPSPSPPRTLRL